MEGIKLIDQSEKNQSVGKNTSISDLLASATAVFTATTLVEPSPTTTPAHIMGVITVPKGSNTGNESARNTSSLRIQCKTSTGTIILLRPEEVAARILIAMKQSAEEYLSSHKDAWVLNEGNKDGNGVHVVKTPSEGELEDKYPLWDGEVRRVVIGVPANYSEQRKEATRSAALLAGFKEVSYLSSFLPYDVVYLFLMHLLVLQYCIKK